MTGSAAEGPAAKGPAAKDSAAKGSAAAGPAAAGPAAAGSATGDAAAEWGCHEVSVRYGRSGVALDRVSLRAQAGQVTAVVGGDGAGKTTLLRLLAGALAPDAGVVHRPAARRTGYLPAGSGVYPDLTVAENLAFRAAAYGSAERGREDAFLARAGLAAARDRLAGRLSGGMRQKLGVIAAMVHRPDLLVLDEPTTGIDPVSRSDLWWLIARAAAAGSAVVFATSYLDEAERAAWVLALDAGRELAAGTPDTIISAVPGTLRPVPGRPPGEAGRRAWRRAGRWRVWEPPPIPGAPGVPGASIRPDLQDAVTIAALARELAAGEPA